MRLRAGLKYGMYSDAGPKTCLGLPGSRGNEELDAQYFADLGVDFLKYDNCAAGPEDWIVDRYVAMRDALNDTGRPILYSMCNWGVGDSWLWGPKVTSAFQKQHAYVLHLSMKTKDQQLSIQTISWLVPVFQSYECPVTDETLCLACAPASDLQSN